MPAATAKASTAGHGRHRRPAWVPRLYDDTKQRCLWRTAVRFLPKASLLCRRAAAVSMWTEKEIRRVCRANSPYLPTKHAVFADQTRRIYRANSPYLPRKHAVFGLRLNTGREHFCGLVPHGCYMVISTPRPSTRFVRVNESPTMVAPVAGSASVTRS